MPTLFLAFLLTAAAVTSPTSRALPASASEGKIVVASAGATRNAAVSPITVQPVTLAAAQAPIQDSPPPVPVVPPSPDPDPVPTPDPPPTPEPAPSWADPSTVLVIAQNNTGPEAGTGGKNASQYVADYYMQKRGIPAENIVHIATHVENGQGVSCVPGGKDCELWHGGSTNISYAAYMAGVQAPVTAKLNANGGALRSRIKYIVPVYGVPITIQKLGGFEGVSIDSMLAASLMPAVDFPIRMNPYYDRDPASNPPHIDSSASQVLLVSRIDGESAVAAASLVDRAITSEAEVVQGIGYFDYQGLGTLANKDGAYPGPPDYSMLHAWELCNELAPGVNCVLNNQSANGGKGMIKDAPNTAFAWGWYNLAVAEVYTFAPGAVGAQLTSNSGNCIRSQCPGGWVANWLKRGITATWGATAEPFAEYYAKGDNLLGHLWRGYTFGESAYIASPKLQWMMIFVGDPLYRPRMQ